ncbi:unnamed protein product [Meganyctiphanes norvegica]|uniref:Oplophorus-luciferin 2-monooxygenase non-catalytic subunit n=1 Tax=Meganyctiphanes norvegica TaxID=48144 RepID=A0AAV2SHR4_MEGNR
MSPSWYIALVYFTICSSSRSVSTKELQCPSADDIAPCRCSVEEYNYIDCSDVADVHELARVFEADFPSNPFPQLIISNNHNIKHLPNGIFGDMSFEEIDIVSCGLQTVAKEVFINSATTLKKLILKNNKLDNKFDFDVLSEFSVLDYLDMHNNNITEFPVLDIPSLTYLDMWMNPITSLPDDVFGKMPNLTYVDLDMMDLEQLPINLFPIQSQLTKVLLSYNELTYLKEGTFAFQGDSIQEIWLMQNKITTVEAGAFSGLENVMIELWKNELDTLEEAVWRDLLDHNITIKVELNPLVCGCDVGWIVLNSEYHDQIGESTCNNGEYLVDLDPAWFTENC